MRIPVTDLKPGMQSAHWTFLGEPYLSDDAPSEILIRARHRVDGGETTVAYDKYGEIEIVDETNV